MSYKDEHEFQRAYIESFYKKNFKRCFVKLIASFPLEVALRYSVEVRTEISKQRPRLANADLSSSARRAKRELSADNS